MKSKFILLFLSIIFSLLIFELVLRMLRLVPEVNSSYQRHDISWTEKNVVLNSAGYRSKEYPRDRAEDTFRIYAIGDSYTYGWFVDDPNNVYPAIIEKGLESKLNKKVEVINAGAPGFSVYESVQRYINEGQFYHPDLVIFGVNTSRVSSGGLIAAWDPPLPLFIKRTAVYQILVGNFLRKIAESKNHKFLENVFMDENSKDWLRYSKAILDLQRIVSKSNAKLALVIFPEIHPKEPNKQYDFYQYNKRFTEFGKKNNIFIFDPLSDFLKYQNKEDLIINPLDAHPTPQMNKLVAEAFLDNFDVKSYVRFRKPYVPTIETININKNNKTVGKYALIRRIYSEDKATYSYYEIKEGNDTHSIPLIDIRSRQTNYYEDMFQTVESFTATNVIGGSILFYIKPNQKGEIRFPVNLYGYAIAGFENIYGIVNEDTSISADFIDPISIKRSDDVFIINYNKNKNYYIFRISIPVKARQLDIDRNGDVKNITETIFLSKTIEKDSNVLSLFFDRKISGFPQFFVNGQTSFYVFAGNEFMKVKEISYDEKNNAINVTSDKTFRKGQEIMLPILANYELIDGEQISIEVER